MKTSQVVHRLAAVVVIDLGFDKCPSRCQNTLRMESINILLCLTSSARRGEPTALLVQEQSRLVPESTLVVVPEPSLHTITTINSTQPDHQATRPCATKSRIGATTTTDRPQRQHLDAEAHGCLPSHRRRGRPPVLQWIHRSQRHSRSAEDTKVAPE